MFHRRILGVLIVIFTSLSVYSQESFATETSSLTKKTSTRFIVITPEKCGTFLLSKALHLITGKGYIHYFPRKVIDLNDFLCFAEDAHNNNQFVFCHVSPDQAVIDALKKSGYKVFFILRDPRDQLISGMYMIRDGHPLAGIPPAQFNSLDENSQIEELITGELFERPIFEVCYARQIPWINDSSKFIHISRFEHLVGSRGGGDDLLQIISIKSLGKHLGLKISSKKAKMIGYDLFGQTWSFRNGTIGSYHSYFTDHHSELYNTKYYQDLIDLGYECER